MSWAISNFTLTRTTLSRHSRAFLLQFRDRRWATPVSSLQPITTRWSTGSSGSGARAVSIRRCSSRPARLASPTSDAAADVTLSCSPSGGSTWSGSTRANRCSCRRSRTPRPRRTLLSPQVDGLNSSRPVSDNSPQWSATTGSMSSYARATRSPMWTASRVFVRRSPTSPRRCVRAASWFSTSSTIPGCSSAGPSTCPPCCATSLKDARCSSRSSSIPRTETSSISISSRW